MKRKTLFVLTVSMFICMLAGFTPAPDTSSGGAWELRFSRWTDEDERIYQDFVSRLGESGHTNFNRFIRDPGANPFYGNEDKNFRFYADCADFPYIVRAYVAYKLRLPFQYMTDISSGGGDQRYARNIKPTSFKSQNDFTTPQKLFGQLSLVNSGYFRMSPKIDESDHYPVKIQRESIVPGTIYYDPNGHVALVYQVTEDGRIRFIDAHPDQSVSRPWFGAKFAKGSSENVCGFKRWRPIYTVSDGTVRRLNNHNIPDYSANDQYRKSYEYEGNSGLSYFEYVKARLSKQGCTFNPLVEFKNMLEDIHEDVKYRATAVEIAIKKGIDKKPHPGNLPWNIYGTDGLWEEFSTPSRDARLKTAFRELYERTLHMLKMAETGHPSLMYEGSPKRLAGDLIRMYDGLTPQLTVSYKDGTGKTVTLNLHNVAIRLFDLSFDPYHSIDLRWGAYSDGSSGLADDSKKLKIYNMERRLRNQLERVYNTHTGFEFGSLTPPDVDVRKLLDDYLSGQPSTSTVSELMNIETPLQLVQNDTSPDCKADHESDNLISSDLKVSLEGENICDEVGCCALEATVAGKTSLSLIDYAFENFISVAGDINATLCKKERPERLNETQIPN